MIPPQSFHCEIDAELIIHKMSIESKRLNEDPIEMLAHYTQQEGVLAQDIDEDAEPGAQDKKEGEGQDREPGAPVQDKKEGEEKDIEPRVPVQDDLNALVTTGVEEDPMTEAMDILQNSVIEVPKPKQVIAPQIEVPLAVILNNQLVAPVNPLNKDPKLQEEIDKAFKKLLTKALAYMYQCWITDTNPMLSYCNRLNENTVEDLRNSFYLPVIEKPNVTDYVISSGQKIMTSLSEFKPNDLPYVWANGYTVKPKDVGETKLVPMDFAELKDSLYIFDSNKKLVLNTQNNVVTVGRYNTNTLVTPMDHRDVSRLNTLILFMQDVVSKTVFAFLIDAWSADKTCFVNRNGLAIETSKKDNRHLIMVNVTYSCARIQFGSLIYAFALASAKGCTQCYTGTRGQPYDCNHCVTCDKCTTKLDKCPICSASLEEGK